MVVLCVGFLASALKSFDASWKVLREYLRPQYMMNFKFAIRRFLLIIPSEYPLVTHDPNMLKKVTRELTGKIKVSLPEGKMQNFW